MTQLDADPAPEVAKRYTPAVEIVLLLAKAAEPMGDDGACLLCDGRWDPVADLREYIHAKRCPWRLARAWLADQEGWPGPATPAMEGA
jgi:hypothetical protein